MARSYVSHGGSRFAYRPALLRPPDIFPACNVLLDWPNACAKPWVKVNEPLPRQVLGTSANKAGIEPHESNLDYSQKAGRHQDQKLFESVLKNDDRYVLMEDSL